MNRICNICKYRVNKVKLMFMHLKSELFHLYFLQTMEGPESTHNTKISDSAYSNSCSNSQSQRSGSSSKSRHSNSSGSSGYGGKGATSNVVPQPLSKRSKDRKKKKLKSTIQASTSTIADDTHQTILVQENKSVDNVENITGTSK